MNRKLLTLHSTTIHFVTASSPLQKTLRYQPAATITWNSLSSSSFWRLKCLFSLERKECSRHQTVVVQWPNELCCFVVFPHYVGYREQQRQNPCDATGLSLARTEAGLHKDTATVREGVRAAGRSSDRKVDYWLDCKVLRFVFLLCGNKTQFFCVKDEWGSSRKSYDRFYYK